MEHPDWFIEDGRKWISRLEGLSDEPLRRAAQIALAALDRVLTEGEADGSVTQAIAAYDALQTALAAKGE